MKRGLIPAVVLGIVLASGPPAQADPLEVERTETCRFTLVQKVIRTAGDCKVVHLWMRYHRPAKYAFGRVGRVRITKRYCCQARTQQTLRSVLYSPRGRRLYTVRQPGRVEKCLEYTMAHKILGLVCAPDFGKKTIVAQAPPPTSTPAPSGRPAALTQPPSPPPAVTRPATTTPSSPTVRPSTPSFPPSPQARPTAPAAPSTPPAPPAPRPVTRPPTQPPAPQVATRPVSPAAPLMRPRPSAPAGPGPGFQPDPPVGRGGGVPQPQPGPGAGGAQPTTLPKIFIGNKPPLPPGKWRVCKMHRLSGNRKSPCYCPHMPCCEVVDEKYGYVDIRMMFWRPVDGYCPTRYGYKWVKWGNEWLCAKPCPENQGYRPKIYKSYMCCSRTGNYKLVYGEGPKYEIMKCVKYCFQALTECQKGCYYNRLKGYKFLNPGNLLDYLVCATDCFPAQTACDLGCLAKLPLPQKVMDHYRKCFDEQKQKTSVCFNGCKTLLSGWKNKLNPFSYLDYWNCTNVCDLKWLGWKTACCLGISPSMMANTAASIKTLNQKISEAFKKLKGCAEACRAAMPHAYKACDRLVQGWFNSVNPYANIKYYVCITRVSYNSVKCQAACVKKLAGP
jgi:hypothetical protein